MASQEGVFVEEENGENLVGQNDLKKLRDAHFTAGVREGISAGKEYTLQSGFNCGYKEAFCKSQNLGKLRGVLSAVLSYVSAGVDSKTTQENCEKIKILLTELANVEAKQIKEMKACFRDGEITQENVLPCDCGNTFSIEQKSKDNSGHPDVTELWNKCKHFCNEIGIDIQMSELCLK